MTVFESFNLIGTPECRQENKRVKDIILNTFKKIPECEEMYAKYRERWNGILERRAEQEKRRKKEKEEENI